MNAFWEKLQDFLTPTKANFIWMMLANGIYGLCQWGMLVILAKMGNPEVVGQFALASAIITPVIMITNMQLRSVQATDAKKEYFLSDYVAVRILSTAAAFLVILLVLCFGHFSSVALLVTAILTLAKAIESLSDVFYGFFQQHEKMGFMAKSMIIKGVISVVGFGLFFYLSSSLPWALAGLSGAWLLVLIFYDWKMGRHLMLAVEGISRGALSRSLVSSFMERRGILVRIIVLAFPLGIATGLLSLDANVPRYVINKYLGTSDLGIFAALAYTTVAVNMFIQALGQAVSPRLARHFAEGDFGAFYGLLKKMVLINFMVGMTGVLVILLGGEKILALIYTQEYAAYSKLFLLLMVSATFSGIDSAFGYAVTAARQFAWQVPLFSTALMATFIFSFLLIPHFKLYGAGLALILCDVYVHYR